MKLFKVIEISNTSIDHIRKSEIKTFKLYYTPFCSRNSSYLYSKLVGTYIVLYLNAYTNT